MLKEFEDWCHLTFQPGDYTMGDIPLSLFQLWNYIKYILPAKKIQPFSSCTLYVCMYMYMYMYMCIYIYIYIYIYISEKAWRRQWHPTPILLPGKSHGRRSLVGGSPWGRTESDTTERLHFHFSLSCIGEGNGNPLQSSCLENPRDREAWWAAVYGVARSRTRLK